MAQQFPTTAQAIYDALSADTTFTALLGTYDFKTGDGPITALSIVSAGEDMPSLRNVQGVECIIQDAGNSTTLDYLTEAPYIITEWSVFLVAWEPAKGSGVQAAVARILNRFVGSTSVQTIATTDGLGSLVQTKVMIESHKPIRPV